LFVVVGLDQAIKQSFTRRWVREPRMMRLERGPIPRNRELPFPSKVKNSRRQRAECRTRRSAARVQEAACRKTRFFLFHDACQNDVVWAKGEPAASFGIAWPECRLPRMHGAVQQDAFRHD
jgi:hypothetical protein